ncbi:MAG TPA: MFS transporter [Spirochaetales bacterium]|nr:MFS transporter [Spirochaetales bacterium]
MAERNESLFRTLTGLKGNARACVYTEPMWGFSMMLCLPYASVYMLALGIEDAQIGLLTTVGMLSQVVFGLLGGVITDKLGRRKTTAIFDFIAWSVPCLIWMFARNFWFFLGAQLVNGAWKVTQNSWDCLLVEDVEQDKITKVYSLVVGAGQLSALFAPIASVLVARYSLVPAVRILYLNAFVVMTAKLVILYAASRETATGVIRMRETKGKSLLSLMSGYGEVVKIIVRSRGTVFSLVIAAIVGSVGMVNNTFWQVIASKKLMVPDAALPFFPMLRSILAMLFLFTAIPRAMESSSLRRPLLLGFASYLVGQGILALIPAPLGGLGLPGYAFLCLSLAFDGFGAAILAMLAESLVALHVDKDERARVMALQHMIIMLATAPFGWISGLLSSVSRTLPFVLTLALLVTGIACTARYYGPSIEKPLPITEHRS